VRVNRKRTFLFGGYVSVETALEGAFVIPRFPASSDSAVPHSVVESALCIFRTNGYKELMQAEVRLIKRGG
jgi:hypothetical protein